MRYLWSTNDKTGAKLIRWGGGDKSSHFAKYYPSIDRVVESRLDTGVRQLRMADWLACGNKVIYDLEASFTVSDEHLYQLDLTIIGKKYDRLGVLWKAVTTLVGKVWRTATFRPRNQWGNRDHYFCVEILETHDFPMSMAGVRDRPNWENAYPEEAYEFLSKYKEVFKPWQK